MNDVLRRVAYRTLIYQMRRDRDFYILSAVLDYFGSLIISKTVVFKSRDSEPFCLAKLRYSQFTNFLITILGNFHEFLNIIKNISVFHSVYLDIKCVYF